MQWSEASAKEEDICRQATALDKTDFTLGAQWKFHTMNVMSFASSLIASPLTCIFTDSQASAKEEEICRQAAALKKTEYTLGACKAELERGLQAREATKTRIAGKSRHTHCFAWCGSPRQAVWWHAARALDVPRLQPIQTTKPSFCST